MFQSIHKNMGELKHFDVKGNLGIIANPNNREVYNKYLHEISKVKPLTREEEVEVFKQINSNNKKLLKEKLSKLPPQSKENKIKLFEEIQLNNNQVLKNKIAKHNLAFVISVAKKYSAFIKKSMLTLEDLVSEGNMGLYIAIDKFDYTTGYKFISYAIWHIRAQILKCIGDNIKSVRVPVNVQQILRKLLLEEGKLEQKLGGAVNTDDLFEEAKRLGIMSENDDINKLIHIIGNVSSDKSLSDLLNHEGVTEFSETIESEDASPSDLIEQKELHNVINQIIKADKQIKQRDKEYLALYYGLYDNIKKITDEEAESKKKELTEMEDKILKLEGEKIVDMDADVLKKINDEIADLKEAIKPLKIKLIIYNNETLTYEEIGSLFNRTGQNVNDRIRKSERRIRNRFRTKMDFFVNNY